MNTRFTVATHILVFLQTQNGQPVASGAIASSVKTNPAHIRRQLSQLAKAGLTKSQMGTGGGALLAKPSPEITLLDAHRAIDEAATVFALHPLTKPPCPVGEKIRAALQKRLEEVEKAMQAQLLKRQSPTWRPRFRLRKKQPGAVENRIDPFTSCV